MLFSPSHCNPFLHSRHSADANAADSTERMCGYVAASMETVVVAHQDRTSWAPHQPLTAVRAAVSHHFPCRVLHLGYEVGPTRADCSVGAAVAVSRLACAIHAPVGWVERVRTARAPCAFLLVERGVHEQVADWAGFENKGSAVQLVCAEALGLRLQRLRRDGALDLSAARGHARLEACRERAALQLRLQRLARPSRSTRLEAHRHRARAGLLTQAAALRSRRS
eukprot:2118454-Rhodomonas_salina.1